MREFHLKLELSVGLWNLSAKLEPFDWYILPAFLWDWDADGGRVLDGEVTVAWLCGKVSLRKYMDTSMDNFKML